MMATDRENELEEKLRSAQATLDRLRSALASAGEPVPVDDEDLPEAVSRLAARLRDSEQHFQRSFGFSAVAQVLVDRDTRFRQANEAFCEMFGYSAEEVAHMKITDVLHPDSHEKILEVWKDFVAGKMDHYSGERRYLRKDGRVVHAYLSASAVRTPDGDFVGAIHIQDVTAQVEFAKALRESETRLKLAIRAANIGIWEYDPEEQSLVWNSQMHKIYGIPAENFTGKVDEWRSALHPEDSERVLENLNNSMLGEENYHPEFRIIRPDGEVRYIEAHAHVERGPAGEALRVFGVNLDRTEVHLSAEKLAQEEHFRRQITEAAPVGIFVWSVALNGVRMINKQYEEITGYSLEELRELGPEVLDRMYHPEQAEELRRHDEELLNDRTGKVFETEYRTIHKTGREYWCISRETVLSWDENGLPAEILGVGMDITAQKEALALLEQRELISRVLVEESQTLVNASREELDTAIHHLLARVGEISEADRSYIFLFDKDRLHMRNTHEWCAEGIDPEIGNLQNLPVGAAPGLTRRVLQRENVIIVDVTDLPDEWAAERTTLAAQGIQSAIMIPMISGDSVMGFTGFDAVRSRKTWSEDQIRLLRIMSDLVAAVLHRRNSDQEKDRLLTELIEAKEHAEAGSRAKDDFLAVMSHELRTPLNPILGFGEILLENCTDEEERDYIETIIQSAQRQLKLINSILSYSRLDKMSVHPEKQPVHLLPVFREALKDVKHLAHGLELHFRNGREWEELPDDCQVLADPGMIRQILDNLLSNACKYTREGGITLSVGWEDGPPQRVCFAVEDTGIGIPETLRERVFDPFTQADSSHSREYEGAGLGLAICRKLCVMLGGEIDFESTPGKGTRFWVKLPVETVNDQAQSHGKDDPQKRQAPQQLPLACNILIVDDRPDNAFLLGALVRRFGCQATVAKNGQQAVDLTAEHPFHAILMDLSMPGMDGFEATRRIRRSGNPNAQTPIFAITADVSRSVRERCEAEGMIEFLPKPIDHQALFQALLSHCCE